VQRFGDDCFFRLDDQRALAWLAIKVERAVAALRGGAAAGAAFESLTNEQLRQYAVDLLGEYLSPAWLDRLRNHLGCAAPVLGDGVSIAPVGHVSQGGGIGGELEPDSKKPKQPPPMSAAAKMNASRAANNKEKNAKAAQGCAPLASFFKGKS
jgi:ribonuclease H2 subunit B